MSQMLRKHISINTQQNYLLKAKASELHITESELIRKGIEKVITAAPIVLRDIKAWEREKKFISSIVEKGPVKGGRKWKREDIYDRKVSGRH